MLVGTNRYVAAFIRPLATFFQAVAGPTCEACGISYLEFRNQGRFGCPNDYDAFVRIMDKDGDHRITQEEYESAGVVEILLAPDLRWQVAAKAVPVQFDGSLQVAPVV